MSSPQSGSMSSPSDDGKSPGYLKREEIIGKPVVTTDAIIIGNVRDIAVSIDGKVALQVDRKISERTRGGAEQQQVPNEIFVSSEEIQAVGDVVLLRYASRPGVVPRSAEAAKPPAPVPPQAAAPGAVVASPPPPFLGTTTVQSKICPNCKYSNNATSRFCIKCGTSLTSVSPS
ncbi:MAG TPA: PRC-barrel domain-containing protein [Nitrososphaerales archaeon]|nr:PRC-barrel domain-containing protein [Nitrososphaerales archaeon]